MIRNRIFRKRDIVSIMNAKRGIAITIPSNKAAASPTNLEKLNEMRKILHKSSSQNDESDNNTSWDQLWKNELTPWDIGKPTPVLISELNCIRESYQRQQELKSSDARIKLEKNLGKHEVEVIKSKHHSLIPGCGGGYDLLTVAKHHELQHNMLVGSSNKYSDDNSSSVVIGLDISPISLMMARDRVQHLIDDEKIEEMDITSDPCKISKNKSERNKKNGNIKTSINFMHGDFFAPESAWSNKSSIQYPKTSPEEKFIEETSLNTKNTQKSFETMQKFDFIFDYTFFCALPPSLRAQWGERMSTLLQPHSGKLLTLMFPIPLEGDCGGAPAMEGPPFPVTIGDYKNVLEPHGFQLIQGSPYEHQETVKPRIGRELVSWWKLVPNAKSLSKL